TQRMIQAQVKRLKPADAKAFCELLRQKLKSAPARVKRRYVQALVETIEVSCSGTVIDGSCDALADMSRSLQETGEVATAGVRSSVRKWRRGWDSNPRYG